MLKRNGLSVSEFIRNSMEYVSRSGTVPESGRPSVPREGSLPHLKQLLAQVEGSGMPGREDFAGLSEDEAVERARLERYGYGC